MDRAIIVSVDMGEFDAEQSIDELTQLCKTAGISVVNILQQKRASPDNATAIGSGRLEELTKIAEATAVDYCVFDMELSPSQIKNLEDALPCPVIDRTMLILSIFSDNAHTAEGKLQVELASLKYRLPRLMGKGAALSRLGGGGSGGGGARRGAGESKLELDRRHLRHRIDRLSRSLKELENRRELRRNRRKKQGVLTVSIVGYKLELDRRHLRHRIDRLSRSLKELENRRELRRNRRKKQGVLTVSIVGYTNAGKSTLLNTLTGAGVLAEDKLFATLDPTARALILPTGRRVLLVDTVGLVSRLPHQLVEAFHSTLEEAMQSDLILVLCDASDENFEHKKEVVLSTLDELGAGTVPRLFVLNKLDRCTNTDNLIGDIAISATTGKGIDRLLEAIDSALPQTHRMLSLKLPYSHIWLEGAISKKGFIFSTTGKGIDRLLEAIDSALPQTHRMLSLKLPYSHIWLEGAISKKGFIFSREYVDDGLKLTANVSIEDLPRIDSEFIEDI